MTHDYTADIDGLRFQVFRHPAGSVYFSASLSVVQRWIDAKNVSTTDMAKLNTLYKDLEKLVHADPELHPCRSFI